MTKTQQLEEVTFWLHRQNAQVKMLKKLVHRLVTALENDHLPTVDLIAEARAAIEPDKLIVE